MAKDRKLKVPKRVAGIKVPKKLRKSANKALAIAESPQARELAVAALTAAATALTTRSAEGEGRPALRPGEGGTDDRAGRLADAVIAAALDGARRLLDGLEPSAATEPEPEPPAAKPARRRASGARPAAAPAGPADA